jgi:hypothetical protein
MKPFLMIILCFCVFACATNTKNTESNLLWHFNAKQNNSQMDHQVQPIITGYQELLKGVANKDTSYIKETSFALLTVLDSIAGLSLSTDTALQSNWVTGVGNISAELQGVVESNTMQDAKELTLSMNMTAVQILQLLSEIGYKEHNIYIFNAPNEYIEDGVYWLSLLKNTVNPFNEDKKKEIQAVGILQEMK